MQSVILAAVVFLTAYSPSHSQKAQVFQKDGAAILGYDAVGFLPKAKR
jgi:hypothetical protein